MSLAWHTAVIGLQGFAGKPPDLADLLSSPPPPRQPRSPEDLQAAVAAWLGQPNTTEH